MEHNPQQLSELISPNVKCMQCMLFVKGPGKVGQSWHQDEYYIPTRDKSLTGVWIAIDDASVENGCLWVVPGSHKPGYIMSRVANSSMEYADVDTIDVSGYQQEEVIPLEAKRAMWFSSTAIFCTVLCVIKQRLISEWLWSIIT